MSTVSYSIVIPVFNEEGNIEALYQSLKRTFQQIGVSYEIIFSDDGSSDNSFAIVRRIAQNDSLVRGISLSRNFGHQIALAAGLEHAQASEAVIMMDADMQHPPEMIPEMLKKYNEGFDIVNTIRKTTDGEGFLKKLTSKTFYKLLNRLSEVPIESAAADFRLMNRKTVDAFLRLKEKDRFTRGLISWMGFRQAKIFYDAPARNSGESKYTVKKMIRFAIAGLTSFSAKPLRISFYAGLLFATLGLLYAVFAVIENIRGNTVEGWTSILVSVLIIGGVQLISIGIIGEYLARVFSEAKDRPLYFIKEDTKTTGK
jgi:polyisoprenyl-phosphate glycosyltransferase